MVVASGFCIVMNEYLECICVYCMRSVADSLNEVESAGLRFLLLKWSFGAGLAGGSLLPIPRSEFVNCVQTA